MLHLVYGINHLSLRRPHSSTSFSIPDWPVPASVTSSSLDSPLCSSITSHSFTPSLKPTCFTNPSPYFHCRLPPTDCLHGLSPIPFLFQLSGFSCLPCFFSFSVPCARLSPFCHPTFSYVYLPFRQLLSARKYSISYRIVLWIVDIVNGIGQIY